MDSFTRAPKPNADLAKHRSQILNGTATGHQPSCGIDAKARKSESALPFGSHLSGRVFFQDTYFV